MPDLHLVAVSGLTLCVALLALWLLSLALRNSSIVDIFWGLGFATVAGIGLPLGPGESHRKWLVATLVTVWGVRLAGYLAWRNLGHGEDKRYAAMRAKYRPWWLKSLAIVFVLQGTLIAIVALPVDVAMSLARPPLGPLDVIGAAVALTGIAFESLGDLQLARFKRAHPGEVMRSGLWKYTRHPNYFGDFVFWWGIWLIAAATGLGAWTVLSPLVMSFLLMRVSGVPMTEAEMLKRPGYEEYVRTTSAFFPRPAPSRPRPPAPRR